MFELRELLFDFADGLGLGDPVGLELTLDVAVDFGEQVLHYGLGGVVEDLLANEVQVLLLVVDAVVELEDLALYLVKLLLGCIGHSGDGVVELLLLPVEVDFIHNELVFLGL